MQDLKSWMTGVICLNSWKTRFRKILKLKILTFDKQTQQPVIDVITLELLPMPASESGIFKLDGETTAHELHKVVKNLGLNDIKDIYVSAMIWIQAKS